MTGDHPMATLGALTGAVAHDFNNALTVIAGHARLLLDELAPGDPGYEDAEAIIAAADHAAALAGELLSFGRVDEDEDASDVNRVAAGVSRLLRGLAGERIALRYAVTPGVGRARVCRARLEQVIANLVINARDAMPAGGTITIATDTLTVPDAHANGNDRGPCRAGGRHALGVVDILPPAPGEYVRLCVADTGAGIERDQVIRIFQPGVTTKERGSGLGLATVLRVTNAARGGVRVLSEVGVGTRFEILLPRVD